MPFQVPVKVWSYLSFLAWAIVGIPAFLDQLGITNIAMSPTLTKILIAIGGLAAAYRRLKDDDHNGIPDIFEKAAWIPPTADAKAIAKQVEIAKTLPILLVFLMLACARPVTASPPRHLLVSVRADSSSVMCTVDAPSRCRMVVSDSGGAERLRGDRNSGEALSFVVPCSVPFQRIVLEAKAYGLTVGGTQSAGFAIGYGSGTCPDVVPNTPRSVTITIRVGG